MCPGHEKDVVELAIPCGQAVRGAGTLVSLAKDGNIRLWDVPAAVCLASYQSDATAMVRRQQVPLRCQYPANGRSHVKPHIQADKYVR